MKTAAAVLAGMMFALGGVASAHDNPPNGTNSQWQNQQNQQNQQRQTRYARMQRQSNNRHHVDHNRRTRQMQRSMHSRQRQMQSQTRQNHGDRQQRTTGTMSGTIVAVKTVKFNDGNRYVLAKVRSRQGGTMVMNLGSARTLASQRVRLNPGNQIQARGTVGQINRRPVLVVYQFRLANGTNNAGDFDAGRYDSGFHDTGPHDTGVYDAGYHDNGRYDAGMVDNGYYDTGLYDTGYWDSGPYDVSHDDYGVYVTNYNWRTRWSGYGGFYGDAAQDWQAWH